MSVIPKPPSLDIAGPYNITMQFYTLLYIEGAMSSISGILDRMQIRMVATVLSTLSIACAVKILIHRDTRGNRKKLLCVTTAMYVATLVYWVAFVVSEFQTLRAAQWHLSNELWWLQSLGTSLVPPSECFPGSPLEDSLQYCTSVEVPLSVSYRADRWDITQGDCIGTATLTFNVVIGDAIVWWRVWVLWNRNRPILAACGIILLATLACADSTVFNFTEIGTFFGGNEFGLVAIILSLFSNTLATLLVGYKAW
ncbi:hypothetical protein GSI_09805 [Ganoderma sinense ZZ0214-1]|uniref:Uncharacterized protein n=1 Tax=Ganoderma sinense ZZ0214-1 TaxID=1077348 RepID=A0A2G8S2P1_9APHY|nr:hypothetical protein GSI_09805 [Ganoderma sinense ZZ0214-1]